jgi:hypothetical protein
MTPLIDHLRDIVQHTYGLGFIDLVKASGTKDETSIAAIADDRSVIIQALCKAPMMEFVDATVGLPNLQKLSIILNIPEYKEGASVAATKSTRDGVETISGLHFENKTGDFKNDYRFMSQEIVNEKLRSVKFKGVKWNVDFEPTNHAISRLKYMSQANSEESVFTATTKSSKLVFSFGDHSTHAGNFVFCDMPGGELKKEYKWPVAAIIAILSLSGDKTFKMSDEGAAMITVDSGLFVYEYIIPAQQK